MKCCECKSEEAVILTGRKEVFCLDCYKQLVKQALSSQTEFVYPEEITIIEGKTKHVFAIGNSISQGGLLWTGIEKDGFYEVHHLTRMGGSFETSYLEFIEKIIDTVFTKTIEKTFISTTWNVLKSDLGDVHMAKLGQISIREDDLGHIFFVIDGMDYSPAQLADMLAPYKGKTLQYRISEPTVPVMKPKK